MVSMIEPMLPHVPAWKRLGLKLKYAKDTPEDVIHTAGTGDSVPNSKKRGRSEIGVIAESTPTKKSKKTALTSTEKPRRKDATPIESSRPQEQTPQSPAATPTLTKRKSVAFTPETKTEDGDSVKQLYHTWLAEQKPEDLFSTPTHASQALKLASPSPLPPSNDAPVKKSKPPKKEKKTKTPPSPQPTAPSASPPHPSPTLEYLTNYHTSRPTWKFNKSKQTHLLKHLFDPLLIPLSHDTSLSSYLAGLQGASARARIRSAASTLIEADDDALATDPGPDPEPETETGAAEMEDPARRREYYLHALQRYKAQLKGLEIEREDRERELDPMWRLRLLKRKRAEMVLWATGGDVDAGTAEVQAQAMDGNGGGVMAVDGDGNVLKKVRVDEGGKKKRRRKRRTGVPDDDDESSSSSSSSSSESSSSGEEDSGDEEKDGGGARSGSSSSEEEKDSSSGSDSSDTGSSSSGHSESGSDSDSDSG